MPKLADVMIIPLFLFSLFLFLLPGIYSVSFMVKKKIDERFALLSACGIMSLVSYIIFWLFYADHILGRISTVCLFAFSLAILVLPGPRRSISETFRLPEIKIPALIMALLGILYISITYSIALNEINLRFDMPGTGADYKIPEWAGNLLYQGQSLWNQVVCIYKTTYADRAPLLPGIYLSQYFLTDTIFSGRMITRYYMAISIAVQLFWVPAVWSLARLSGISAKKTILLLSFLAITGFFFFYSVFTWPKMIAGSLTAGAFIALVLVPWLSNKKPGMKDCLTGGLFAGLGFLGHGAGGLMLVPIAAFLLRRRYFPGFRNASAGLVAFVILVAPWMIVKGHNEPDTPGLIRFSLVEHNDKDIYENKELSIPEAIYRTYKDTRPESIVATKLDGIGKILFRNLEELGHPWDLLLSDGSMITKYRSMSPTLRNYDIRYLLRSLGVLLFGLFFLLPFFRRSDEQFLKAKRITVFFMVFSLATFLFTFILFYRFKGIHYTSLTATTLLFVALILPVLTKSLKIFFILFIAQLVYFIIIWVFAIPSYDFTINWFMVAIEIALFALVPYVIWILYKRVDG